jgi:hypothetical protein
VLPNLLDGVNDDMTWYQGSASRRVYVDQCQQAATLCGHTKAKVCKASVLG